jgi:hypothetical protein
MYAGVCSATVYMCVFALDYEHPLGYKDQQGYLLPEDKNGAVEINTKYLVV